MHSFIVFCFKHYDVSSKLFFIQHYIQKRLGYLSLDRMFTYILLILTSWFVSILVIIPAFTTFNVFSYFPQQYHCLISFANVSGFAYSILSTYVIPVLVIINIYSRLIIYIHYAFNFNHTARTRREIKIVKRILTI